MATIDNSGARISTQAEFYTYRDIMVSGSQTSINVTNLEPSTQYYAKAIATVGSTTYVSDNYVAFRTAKFEANYLTFTANEPNVSISMSHYGTNQTTTKPVIYWSMDKTRWTQWDFTPITLASAGQKVYMYGNNTYGIGKSDYNYSKFVISGSVGASGDCTTLISRTGSSTAHVFSFYSLFSGCEELTTAPELSATDLRQSCYRNMFYNCTALTTAPALPATTLAGTCYYGMFSGCTSLTTAPALPATTVAPYCYAYMFNGCTSLTAAPALPAETLANMCYFDMFYGCTSLTTAPALPATTLASQCYEQMFRECTSLTTAPALPATTLEERCYNSMFQDCTSLTAAPALPAETLAKGCYLRMFKGCTSLITAPSILPATTLAQVIGNMEGCYCEMFCDCTSLTNAPELPATTLETGCYAVMFSRCTSLTTAPELPATTLTNNCYYNMFYGCSSLNEVTCLAENISAGNCTYNWLSNVAATGTFYKSPNMSSWTTGTSGIPSGWAVEDLDTTNFLTFTANEPNVTIGMTHYGNNSTSTKPVIYISRDKTNWTEWDYTSITLASAGQKIYMHGDNPYGIGRNDNDYSSFQFSGSVAASGDCTTLLDYYGDVSVMPYYGFYRLFRRCRSLTTAPELPATTMAQSCYEYMFGNCTSMTTAPALPATTLASSCYYHMFTYCTSLTTAPALPATTMAQNCYAYMFQNCSSLMATPVLPATTLADRCYKEMFNGCSSLNEVTCLATDISATECTAAWLANVYSDGTFYKASGMNDWESGQSGIPYDWTVVDAQ